MKHKRKLSSLIKKLLWFRRGSRRFSDSRTEAEMLSNAAIIAAIGTLEAPSAFSSRENSDLEKVDEQNKLNHLTEALIASTD